MKKWYAFIFTFLLFGSCKKEATTWDIDTLLPLLHTQMTIQQAIPDSLITTDSSNLLRFEYSGQLFDFSVDSLFNIPDTTVVEEFNLPWGSITFQPGQVFLSDSTNSNYKINEAKLTALHIHSGSIELRLVSSLNGPSVLEYTIPSATKNGLPFYIKENIPAGTNSNPAIFSKTYSLSGYNFDLSGPNQNNFNIIQTHYKVYIDSNSAPVVVNSGDKFTIYNTLTNIIPNYARGYFGSELISQTGTDTANIFELIQGGKVDLDEVNLTFTIQNEIGADLQLTINEITGNNTYNNSAVSLSGDIVHTPINLNRGTEPGNFGPVSPSILNKQLNSSNSNVANFVSNVPNEFLYDVDIHFNPLGNVSNSNDFIYYQTGLKVGLSADIPFFLKADHLVLSDTSDFNINPESEDDVKQIQGGQLLIYTANWYPFDVQAQFYLLNENNIIIDSLFQQMPTINGGIPDTVQVLTPTETTLSAPVNAALINNLYLAKKIKTTLTFHTTTANKVKVFSPYLIDITIVGNFNYMMRIN